MTVETRYFRSDTEDVNGLDTEKLRTTKSGSAGTRTQIYVDPELVFDAFYWASRVWKRDSGGSETEITPGYPIAQVTRSPTGSGYQNNSWNCPITDLDPTDSIVVRVYVRARIPGRPPTYTAWLLLDTWQTEQLGADGLPIHTLTFYYWTRLLFDGQWTWTLEYKFDGAFDTRITNFTWTPVAPPVVAVKPVWQLKTRGGKIQEKAKAHATLQIGLKQNFNSLTPISS